MLRIDDVTTTTPGAGEVLIRVAAASVNAHDWHIMRGEPRLARLADRSIFGLSGLRDRIRGTDSSGTVEAVGTGVTAWAPGQEVYGESTGAFAEYVTAPETVVAAKPTNLTFEQAAAIPLAAHTA